MLGHDALGSPLRTFFEQGGTVPMELIAELYATLLVCSKQSLRHKKPDPLARRAGLCQPAKGGKAV